MKKVFARACFLTLGLLAAVGAIPHAAAQDFPNHPVKIVVPWPPGGNVDFTARTVQPALAEALGQQVIVENRAGAGGTIGSAQVAKSSPDGYTLLLGSSGTISSAPAVFRNIAYDPAKDFVAVGAIQYVPMVLTAAPNTPAATYAELLNYIKNKKNPVSIASAGNGSSNHLAIELLMRQAKLPLLHVPYKGSGPAITDLLGSQVETMMDQLTASIEHIRNGKLKALAVTSLARSPLLPNVPTLDELGVRGYEAGTYTGLFAPAGTPPAVVARLHGALRKALADPGVRERYRNAGADVWEMSQPAFDAYVRGDVEKWRKVAREANIVVD
ncbi:MAG TPA: tripartite tricarboxylate transporter substrate binding protein [Burkholderiales bacterium]|nr:tripartite tricarboxylate transporter substrate binding protein [Burkholderiales bacterium]